MVEKIIEDKWDEMADKELSAEAYKHWELVWENPHLVKSRDYWLVILYVETFEEYKLLKNKLKPKRRVKGGPVPTDLRVHENSNGTVQTGPYKAQLKEIWTELRRLASELGLSPTSAANLKLINSDDSQNISEITTPLNRGI